MMRRKALTILSYNEDRVGWEAEEYWCSSVYAVLEWKYVSCNLTEKPMPPCYDMELLKKLLMQMCPAMGRKASLEIWL